MSNRSSGNVPATSRSAGNLPATRPSTAQVPSTEPITPEAVLDPKGFKVVTGREPHACGVTRRLHLHHVSINQRRYRGQRLGVLLADGRKDPIEDKFLPMVVYGDRFADVAPMSGLPIVRL